MREKLLAAAIACAATLGPCLQAIAQDSADQKLGTVHFATSCNEIAQRRFDRAMRYQHSFWYKASQEIYQETIAADPQCAIAYWGTPQLSGESEQCIAAFAQSSLAGLITAKWQRSPYRALRQNALRMLIATSPDMQVS